MNTRPTRRFLPLLIYLLPLIADMLVAQFIFINAVRLARAGASASVVANTLTVWSLAYLITCPVIGRFVSASNAAHMMVGSMGGFLLIGLLFTVIPGVAGVYVLMAAAGIAAAFFFTPFQIFMKAVDGLTQKPITYSTGLYTFSWSAGYALGPFVSGFLMDRGVATPDGATSGWKYACYFAAGAAVVTGVCIVLLKHLAQGKPQEALANTDDLVSRPVADYSHQPDLAWMGWVSGGVGMVAITFIRAVFPARVEACLHLTQSMQGFLFFLVSASQAITGLVLCRSRYWMYRPTAVAAFGCLGIIGLLIFGFSQTPLAFSIGAVLFGLYSGSFFFYLVFHSLVHPRRSAQYVAINETVVGICGMVGAIVGGGLADRFGFGLVYAAGAALVLLVMVLQGTIHSTRSGQFSN
ncbi:MAG: MFS transporter [bacterium]